MTRGRWPAGVRFVAVGLLSLAVDFGVYVVLYRLTPVGVSVAAALGYTAAFVVNFGLNRSWVFGSMAAVRAQVPRYLLLVLLNLAATVVAVTWLVRHGAEYRLAKLGVAAVLAAVNFQAMRHWVFAAPSRA